MNMQDRFIKGVVRYRWLVIVLSVLAIAVIAKGGEKLIVESNSRVFFDGEFKQRIETDYLEAIFGRNKNLSIVISPESGSVYSEKHLQFIYELTEQAWETPYSSRVDSLTNYQHTSVEGDDLLVDYLVPDPDAITPAVIAHVRSVAAAENDLMNRLVNRNGDVAIVDINFNLPTTNDLSPYFVEIFAHLDAVLADLAVKHPGVNVMYSGDVYLNNSFGTVVAEDLSLLTPIVLLVITVLLIFLYRSLLATLASVVVIISSVLVTMGAFGWMGFALNTPSAAVPVFIMTLAVADAVHVITTMLVHIKHGAEKHAAILDSFHLNFKPIFITSITTAAGMLTMNFSESPPFRDMGNMVALGVMVAFVLSVTLLPALLSVLPVKSRLSEADNTGMEKFGRWVAGNPVKLFVGYGLFAVAMSSVAILNVVNDEPDKYFDEGTEVRQSIEFLRENMSGLTSLDIGVFSGEEGMAASPEFLTVLENFTDWMREHPSVAHVYSLSDTFKRLNQNMHGGDAGWYKMPESRELAAQYLLLYEMSLPLGLDLNNRISIDKSATRLNVLLEKTQSSDVVAFEQDARQWFAVNAPQMEIYVGGATLMFAHIGEKNIPATVRGLFIAVVVISLMLVVALRSWKMGFISLLPNFLPISMGFGFWALYMGEINLAVSVVASIAIGIVVDDCVHFLSKYQHAKQQGMRTEEAVEYAFATVGRALLTTTVALTAGFSLLMLSSFLLVSAMGILTTVVVVLALATDFLFLPSFIILLDRFLVKRRQAAALNV